MKRKAPESEPDEIEKKEEVEETSYKICYFQAVDKSVVAVDITEALSKGMSELFLFVNNQYPSHKEKMGNPVKLRLPTAESILQSMGFLSMFFEEREIVSKDISLLKNAIDFAVNILCSKEFLSNLRGGIEKWLLKADQADRPTVLTAMSAWTGLSDPTLPENKGICLTVPDGLDKVINNLPATSDLAERKTIQEISFLVCPRYLSYLNPVLLDSDSQLTARSVLLDPKVWKKCELSRLFFCGQFVSHLASNRQVQTSHPKSPILVLVEKTESASEDITSILGWINDDVVLEFRPDGAIVAHRERLGCFHIRLVDHPWTRVRWECSLDQCYIQFTRESAIVSRSDACVVSHQRKAVVNVELDRVPFTAARGVAVFDDKFRCFDQRKLDRLKTNPMFGRAFSELKTEGSCFMEDGIVATKNCVPASVARDAWDDLEKGEDDGYETSWKRNLAGIAKLAQTRLDGFLEKCIS
jgi:hypothetical protein